MKVTTKQILRKVDSWSGNPLWSLGLYRLFIYIPWDSIPSKYKESAEFKAAFKEDIISKWDENLDELDKGVEYDLGEYIKVIFINILSRQIVRAFGLLPVIYADLFILGNKVDGRLGNLSKTIKEYLNYIKKDREAAEALAMYKISEELMYIIKTFNIPTKYEPETILSKVNKEIEKLLDKSPEVNNVSASILKQVDDALDAYEKATGEKVE